MIELLIDQRVVVFLWVIHLDACWRDRAQKLSGDYGSAYLALDSAETLAFIEPSSLGTVAVTVVAKLSTSIAHCGTIGWLAIVESRYGLWCYSCHRSRYVYRLTSNNSIPVSSNSTFNVAAFAMTVSRYFFQSCVKASDGMDHGRGLDAKVGPGIGAASWIGTKCPRWLLVKTGTQIRYTTVRVVCGLKIASISALTRVLADMLEFGCHG